LDCFALKQAKSHQKEHIWLIKEQKARLTMQHLWLEAMKKGTIARAQ